MFKMEELKYQPDAEFYAGLIAWMEMDRDYELSESDINNMERDSKESLTAKNRIVSKVASNNADYLPTKTGA